MPNPLRRSLVTSLAGSALAGAPLRLWAAADNSCFSQAGDTCTEYQRGDPKGPREVVAFNRQKVQAITQESKADYPPRIAHFGELLVDEAARFVGFNRANNRPEIENMLELFGLGFSDANGKPYAFCAAGIGYVAASAYAKAAGKNDYTGTLQALGDINHYHFFPNPGVANMVTVAQINGRWVPVSEVLNGNRKPQPGWLSVFKWNRTDHHIGIVRSVQGRTLQTIEFNTSPEGATGSQANGGAVAERKRALDAFVIGLIDTGVPIRI